MKLPLTEKNQYWCTIKVDGSEQSVQCPGTGLSLKVGVLKQAAGLANSEKTTVRIPIAATGEVANFGVYAVPGLQSHVFVGPFSKQNLRPPIKIAADNGHLDIVKYLTLMKYFV